MKKQLLILSVIGIAVFFSAPVLAQIYHFQEGFVANAPPANWTPTSVTYSNSHNNGLYTGAYSVKLRPTESFMMTPAMNTAGELQFFVKVRDTTKSTAFHLTIEKSYDKLTWTEISKDPCNMKNDSVFQQVKIQVNDNAPVIYLRFHAVSVGGTTTLGLAYIDDVSVTKLSVTPNDATLTDLTYNGISIDGFAATTLEYAKEVLYSMESIAMGGTPNNPAATKQITNPTNLRGTLAERTGSVKVTSQDGTATKTYKIVFTISDYIYKVGFATTGNDLSHMPGWRSAFTTTSNTVPMGNHDYFPGTAAMKFVRGQPDKIGYLNTAKYIKSDSLFFWLAVENPDGVENLLVEKKVGGGVKVMVANITSSKMSGEWQLFKYKIGETDSTEIILTPTITPESPTCRIWIDDLALKGKKVGGTVAVKETPASLISVYPNPASEQLNIRMHKASFSKVEVYDMTGRPVMKHAIEKDSFTLDISKLPKGVYMMTFRDGNRSSSQRFVKIK